MTKKDLIKKILELGKELERAEGFDALLIINDMEIEVDNYTKQLPLHNVNKRYSIEDIEKCVENWGICKVEKEYIERFLTPEGV